MNQQLDQWVKCPICGESDMPQIFEGEGSFIHCTNQKCASNIIDSNPNLPKEDKYKNALLDTQKIIEKQLNLIAQRSNGDHSDRKPIVRSLTAHINRIKGVLND